MASNKKDTSTEGRLDVIADNLETRVGIDPGAARKDWTVPAILKRIDEAITSGAFAEAHLLSDHIDVELAGEVDGDLLQLDAGDWINRSTAAIMDPAYVRRDGTLELLADWDAGDWDIEAKELRVKGTIDHRLYDDGSDNLVLRNANTTKDIILSVDGFGTQYDILTIQGKGPNILIKPNGGITLSEPGIIDVQGTWGAAAAFAVMNFAPTFNSGGPIAFFIQPEFDIPLAASDLIKCKPSLASGRGTAVAALSNGIWGLHMEPAAADSGYDHLYGLAKETFPRTLLTGDTWRYRGLLLGGIATTVHASAILEDIHIELLGGAAEISGSITQYGIKLSGYRILAGSPTQYAIHSDGGTFAWAADNAKIKIGASEDAEIYFDGTDLILDPDAQAGTGALNIIGDMKFSAGGSGLPYSGIFCFNSAGTTSVTSGAWAQFLHFTNNLTSNQCSPDHNNDHITIDVAGKYYLTVSLSVMAAVGPAIVVEFQIRKNNGVNQYNALRTRRYLAGGITDTGAAGISGVVTFNQGDTVELWARSNVVGARDITIIDCNLSLAQVGA